MTRTSTSKAIHALAAGALAAAIVYPVPAFSAEKSSMQGAQTKTPSAALSDAQIAAIVVAANKIDIENGKMAQDKTKTASVKEFSDRMITDHESVNKQTKDLAKKLDLKPEENDTSKNFLKTADQTRGRLMKLTGAEFDRAYIDNEVTFHEQVIDTVDKSLLPNAQNAELKALIQEVRPTLQSHLEHAKQIRSTLQPS